jgi:hypothetical protein
MVFGSGYFCLKLVRCLVVQTRMRSDRIVMATPGFDDDLGFGTTAEPFHVQTLVAELSVETFIGAILPRLTWIGRRGFGRFMMYPSDECI